MTFLDLQSPIRWMFLVHALCGAIALGVFLIPLLSKKGGRLHTRTGCLYTAVMAIVGVTAYVITPWRVIVDPEKTSSSQAFAVFLFFIATLTLAALWHGIIALRFKKRTTPSRALAHIGPATALIVAAAIVEIIGIQSRNTLLILFPVVGVFVARGQLKYWLTTPTEKMHWWYAHMEGMFTACIATITAFLVTAVPRFTDAALFKSPILWIAPGLILGTIQNRWTQSYRRKFEDKSAGR
jgi:hypothetical protein